MTRPGRIAAALLLLACLAAWVLWTAVTTDFNEEALLALGALWFFVALTLSWTIPRPAVKTIIVIGQVAAMLAVGVAAQAAVPDQQQARIIITTNMLQATARSLGHLVASGRDLPIGDWTGLRAALEESGDWQPLIIPYRASPEFERYEHVPRKDAWGCGFEYRRLAETRFRLRSSGPDRRWETADDLVVDQDTPLPDAPRALPKDPRRWFDPNRG